MPIENSGKRTYFFIEYIILIYQKNQLQSNWYHIKWVIWFLILPRPIWRLNMHMRHVACGYINWNSSFMAGGKCTKITLKISTSN